jgi:Predicted integral membrane protein
MVRKFMLSDVLRVSWSVYLSQIWILTGLIIGYVIINLLLNLFVPSPFQGTMNAAGATLSLISYLFSLLFTLGYTKNMFQALDGVEPQFSAYGKESRKLFKILFAGLLFSIIFAIGLALLILPGFYLAIRLQFYYTSIVEEDTGVVSSLKRSWEITKGQEVPLLLLLLTEIMLAILGLLLFVIGIFITAPLIAMMNCYVFRKLTVIMTEEIDING